MERDEHIGDKYQRMTKYSPTRIWSGARPQTRPEEYKEYKGARTVELETDLPEGPLWEALKHRRSRRTFTGEAVTMKDLSNIVWAAQGPTARAGATILRTAPSAGALYPVETYLVANAVEGLEPGAYHYNIKKQVLEMVKAGKLGRQLSDAALGQGMCARASAVFIFCALMDRCKWKYAQRAYRYIYMDAGHICANVYLAAQDLGMGCCAMGAFYDDLVNKLLDIDGEKETAIYLAAIGPVKQGME